IVEIVMTGHAAEGEPGLLLGRHHLDADAVATPRFAHEFASVGRFPYRGRRDGTQLHDSEAVGHRLHPAERLQRLLHRPVAHPPPMRRCTRTSCASQPPPVYRIYLLLDSHPTNPTGCCEGRDARNTGMRRVGTGHGQAPSHGAASSGCAERARYNTLRDFLT